jgi:hypothetical protein
MVVKWRLEQKYYEGVDESVASNVALFDDGAKPFGVF